LPAGQIAAANAVFVDEVSELTAAATTPARITLRNQMRCLLISQRPPVESPNEGSLSGLKRVDDWSNDQSSRPSDGRLTIGGLDDLADFCRTERRLRQ
jgi:hypothetical protein